MSEQILPNVVTRRKVPPPLPTVMQSPAVARKPISPPIAESSEKPIKLSPVDIAPVSGHTELPKPTASIKVPPVHSQVEPLKVQTPLSPPFAPSDTPSSKSHTWKYVLTTFVVLGIGAGIYFNQKTSQQEVACNALLNNATAEFTSGNGVAARTLATQVMSTCAPDLSSRAAELLAALNKAAVAKMDCDKTLRTITSQITDRKMTSARNALDQLDNICTDTTAAKDLRQKVVENHATSVAIEAEIRSFLVQGDANAAGAALERLATQNREHPDLASLKTDIIAATKVVAPPEAIAVVMPSLPSQTSSTVAPVKPEQVVRTEKAAAGQSELVQAFLHDAEQSLAQQKFDAAKTFVESARRVDPTNAQAAVLWRRIKDRELQYLREETSIK